MVATDGEKLLIPTCGNDSERMQLAHGEARRTHMRDILEGVS